MTTLKDFEPATGFVFTHELDGWTAEDRADLRRRLDVIAEVAGLQARFHDDGDLIVGVFENKDDHIVFEGMADDLLEANEFPVREVFDGKHPDYIKVWVHSTLCALEEAELPHTLEQNGNEVTLWFTSSAGRTLYRALSETNYFHKRAEATWNMHGPDLPDLIDKHHPPSPS